MRILIVDDNPTSLKLLAGLVRTMPGCEPLPFDGPEQALGAMPGIDFDIAIIDYVMPAYTGVELVTEMMRFVKYVGKPVIFVTADVDATVRIDALDAGAIDFITKPINPVEFRIRVQNVVELTDARDRLKRDPVSISRETEEEIIRRHILAAGYKEPSLVRRQMRLSRFSQAIARAHGLEPGVAEDIALAAPVISVARAAMPDVRRLKTGRLTETAFRTRRRPAFAPELDDAPQGPLLTLAADIAACHRERWDGQGVPLRLKGEDIPLSARIVAVADAFDALVTERPFKPALGVEAAAAHLASRAGKHFDPLVLAAFMLALPELESLLRQDRALGPTLAAVG